MVWEYHGGCAEVMNERQIRQLLPLNGEVQLVQRKAIECFGCGGARGSASPALFDRGGFLPLSFCGTGNEQFFDSTWHGAAGPQASDPHHGGAVGGCWVCRWYGSLSSGRCRESLPFYYRHGGPLPHLSLGLLSKQFVWFLGIPLSSWGFPVWVAPSTAVIYLGCYVGINIFPEQQITPLLLSIGEKLLHWSTARLSLVGWVGSSGPTTFCWPQCGT